MKNIIKTLVFVMTLVLVLVAFTGCDLEQEINNKKCEIFGHSIVLYADEYYCEEEGLSAGAICEVCGYVERQRFPLKPTGHDFAEATCTEPKTCKTCGVTEGVANNHKWVMVDAVAPTCTKDGLEGYTHCEVCKEYLEGEPAAIPATGHTLSDVEGKAATCTEDGYTAHKVCACGYTEGKEVIPAAHTFGEADANGNATCSACGVVGVTTLEGLRVALAAENANVLMLNDISGEAIDGAYNKAGVIVNAGDVLDGNGFTLTITGANTTWDCAIGATGGTIKNILIAGAMRGIFMPGADGDLVVDGVEFNTIYTFNSDAGSKDYGVTITNSVLNGWTSYSNVHKYVTFAGCFFTEGNGYAFLRAYNETTFVGCLFDGAFQLQSKDVKVVFDGCWYYSTQYPITAEGLATLGVKVPNEESETGYDVVMFIYETDLALFEVK